MSPMNQRLMRPRVAAGGGGSFDPTGITGLIGWWDASDSATLYSVTSGSTLATADGGVARWEDKSGNGLHFTQATANDRPLRRVASLNARDGVEFDGANDHMVALDVNATSFLTLFIVHKLTSATQGPYTRLIELGANNGFAIVFQGSGEAYAYQYAFTSGSPELAVATTNPVVARMQTTAASAGRKLSYLSLNNVAQDSYTTPDAEDIAGVKNLYLSMFGEGSYHTSVTIYEVLYYDSFLSASTVSEVEEYLRSKWNLY